MPSNEDEQNARKEALSSLKRIQTFDPQVLVREKELGVKNFADAVEPSQRLIDLYRRVTHRALDDFPTGKLSQLKQRANSDYQLFDQILTFDVDKPTSERDALIQRLHSVYNDTFEVLHPLISYSLYRAADFQRLESDARAALQEVRDQGQKLMLELDRNHQEAQRVVDTIRQAAAEIGVTQEARYFREAADTHEGQANSWKGTTYKLAIALGIYALVSLFLHKLSFLRPTNSYDAVQLAVSKILIFAVLSVVLYLAAKDFLSHQHNAIVNRHRQNALLTYKTLADAAGSTPNREIILTHAAACIYAPQPTGYSGDGNPSSPGVKSVIEMLTRSTSSNI